MLNSADSRYIYREVIYQWIDRLAAVCNLIMRPRNNIVLIDLTHTHFFSIWRMPSCARGSLHPTLSTTIDTWSQRTPVGAQVAFFAKIPELTFTPPNTLLLKQLNTPLNDSAHGPHGDIAPWIFYAVVSYTTVISGCSPYFAQCSCAAVCGASSGSWAASRRSRKGRPAARIHNGRM